MLEFEDATQGQKDEWFYDRVREVAVAYSWPSYGMVNLNQMASSHPHNDEKMLTEYLIGWGSLPIFPLCPRPMCIVDVGANVGAFTYLASRIATNVIAYEPCKETFRRLSDNVARQVVAPQRVQLHNLAVGATSGQTVYMQKNLQNGNFSGDAYSSAEKPFDDEYEEVKTISIEDILAASPNGFIDYLKVDCEGAEYEFLTGKDLSRVGYIEIELHNGEKEKTEKLIESLQQTHDCATPADTDDPTHADTDDLHNLKCMSRSYFGAYSTLKVEDAARAAGTQPKAEHSVNTDDPLRRIFHASLPIPPDFPAAAAQHLEDERPATKKGQTT